VLIFVDLDFPAFFIAMITRERTIMIPTSNATANDWGENSGTVGVGDDAPKGFEPVKGIATGSFNTLP
jgi:hypothetical protein